MPPVLLHFGRSYFGSRVNANSTISCLAGPCLKRERRGPKSRCAYIRTNRSRETNKVPKPERMTIVAKRSGHNAPIVVSMPASAGTPAFVSIMVSLQSRACKALQKANVKWASGSTHKPTDTTMINDSIIPSSKWKAADISPSHETIAAASVATQQMEAAALLVDSVSTRKLKQIEEITALVAAA